MNKSSDTSFPGGDSLEQAYQSLESVEPGADLDRAILNYAKESTRPARRAWVWPASLAAGLLVTLGIVTQMAQIVPSGSYPRSPVVEVRRDQPQAAPATGEIDQSLVMQSQTIEVEVPGRSAEAWIEQLQDLAAAERTQAFFRELALARQSHPGLSLPENLRQWAELRGEKALTED